MGIKLKWKHFSGIPATKCIYWSGQTVCSVLSSENKTSFNRKVIYSVNDIHSSISCHTVGRSIIPCSSNFPSSLAKNSSMRIFIASSQLKVCLFNGFSRDRNKWQADGPKYETETGGDLKSRANIEISVILPDQAPVTSATSAKSAVRHCHDE